ncbi:DUF3499 domain-containing protein [Nocardioides gansuensis]|uniref:DUF3499 domain-containing protein n=1 Tax=Nocardioides gansuensis TaxID=2138300 RepID=A0A2T8FBL0_9ACTN|nr:DUF3499 domain-containing protein [Nocardioides gansuensis]PVG83097.1 DUF3499 domain-containing protein [Nocardioides gansuensis]
MSLARRCSRTACGRSAVNTLTYVYADQTAVLGPLATYAEPHAYDLCEQHSERLSAPRGWEVLRLAPDPSAKGPSSDDLLALADAVREAARPAEPLPPLRAASPEGADDATRGTKRGHLRVLTSD